MHINRHDRDVFTKLLQSSEDRLIDLILQYAEQQNYTRYTSTLKEAWRLSISGLSDAMIAIVENTGQVPELGPDDAPGEDPGTQFGVLEARRHRARGVSLNMFLGLMKYYRQAYIDLLREFSGFEHPESLERLINRFFDKTELAYCTEWSGLDSETQIQELSKTNLNLSNEKNKYLTLFESLFSPVILCNEKGKVENFNNTAGRLLLGCERSGESYYGDWSKDLEPPQLHEELTHIHTERLERLHVVKTYQTPEGEKVYDVKIKRMLDVSHKFSGYTILFNEITDRLRWERQLEEINYKQQQLIDDLQRTRQQLVQTEKMAAIGQLASGVAHEINTPIQYLLENVRFLQEAFTDLLGTSAQQQKLLQAAERRELNDRMIAEARSNLEEADLDYLLDEVPRALQQSLEGVNRVSTIVSAMNDFARPGTKEKTRTDINNAITSTLHVSANRWKYHAEVETDLDPDLPAIPVLPGELNQALLNIIVNAATAIEETEEQRGAGEKGKIRIHTQRDGEWIIIRISDTGPGIPEAIQSKIFDPFFTTRDVGQGSGQGLTVAYLAIVEKHAGNIQLQSTIGKGTTFTIRLPIEPDSNEDAERQLWRTARRSIQQESELADLKR